MTPEQIKKNFVLKNNRRLTKGRKAVMKNVQVIGEKIIVHTKNIK